MPINNITQTISTIPEAGRRGIDVQTIFVNKQEAFQDALTEVFVGQINTLRTQLNTFVEQLNTTTTQINTDAEIATNAAERATAINNELKNVSVDSTITGIPGTPARVTYSPITGKFTFVIPRGEAFQIDARGAITDRSLYDTKYQGFGFLALDESKVYFKMSNTSGDWSVGLYFGKGDGIVNTVFTSTTDPSGLAGQSGATDIYTINYSNLETDTFIVKNGEDGLDNITDTVIGTETTWSSTKIKELLAQKADKLELDHRLDSLDSTTVKLTDNQTIGGVKTFSSSPVVPTPTTNFQVATKKYVDDAIVEYGAIMGKPVIVSPVNDAVDFVGSITSTYVTTNNYKGTQDWVLWECSTNDTFTNIVDSYQGNANLTSWAPSLGLENTQIFVRTKQGSDGHRSEYSNVVRLTTLDSYIKAPVMTIGGTLSALLQTPTISLSAFSVYGGSDTHTSTDYQVVNKATGVVKWQSLGNTTNKLSITTGQLDINTDYIFRAKFNGQTYGSSAWVEVEGTTVNIYVNTPTITVEGTPNNVPEKPKLTGSAFSVFNGSSTHTSTDWVIEDDGVVVWSSLGNTTNKLTITVPAGILVENTLYTFKVTYNSSTYGSSAFGTRTGTTKSAFFNFDSDFGGFLEGGYYAGKITRADGIYALIVSPKATGQSATTLQWKNVNTTSGGCKSLNDGAANTAYLVSAGNATVYPAAHFCNNLVINGFSDWYLPARDELEIAYRNLKPTTQANRTGNDRPNSTYVYTLYDDTSTAQGINRHSVPTGAAYTTSNPTQTSLAPFKQGGAESFAIGQASYDRHWSSTESSSALSWGQFFSGTDAGNQYSNNMTYADYVRAFRSIKIS